MTVTSRSVVAMELVALCEGLSVPEMPTLWVNSFSVAVLVLSVELESNGGGLVDEVTTAGDAVW